ncbi:HNH endonuclease [Lacrimispora sp.]|uniref:HNH endonuclease n=1 Tax=Lacrimispora sp. TaxID=2719234 RepID=UPI0039925A76
MGLESFVSNLEKTAENARANQAANFEKAFQNSNNEGVKPRHIPTINEGHAGEKVNGVTFARRVFTLNGEKVEGVFPVFKSEFNCKLPENMYKASDNDQMKYCTKKLAERIERDPEFAKKFNSRQLEQIKNGEPRISGLTWHHSEIPGKMQLVNAYDHSAARHTGGRSIWGGGSDSR